MNQSGGDDSTAQIGRIDKPFQTFNAAYDAAVEHPQNAYCDLSNGKFVYDSVNKKYYRYNEGGFVSGDTPQKLKNLTAIPYPETPNYGWCCYITSDGYLWMIYNGNSGDFISIVRLSDMTMVCNYNTGRVMAYCKPLGYHATTKTLYYFNNYTYSIEKAIWDGNSMDSITTEQVTAANTNNIR